jgi:hypothetical protein
MSMAGRLLMAVSALASSRSSAPGPACLMGGAMPTPRVFTLPMVARLREMAAQKYAGPAIAAALSAMQPADKPPLSAEAIRKKACALGIALRPVRPPKQFRVLLRLDTRTVLQKRAAERGVNAAKLAAQLLTVIISDDLVAAVLDTAA